MRRGERESWDDEDDQPGWDDSEGYSDDEDDEEEEYEDFLQREFGHGSGGAHLTPVQYATVILLLIVFVLPGLLYVLVALTQ